MVSSKMGLLRCGASVLALAVSAVAFGAQAQTVQPKNGDSAASPQAANMLLAQAQPAPASNGAQAENVETIVVTGVEASLSGALNIKQNSGQMVDAIVSEDIGKLPDSTVVEALQHVTGISLVRNSVEPSTVLIRGLPDVQTLINGREIFTSTGRALSLPDVPAELLARVDVNKTSTSTDLEGGIAGIIDIRFHRPFDFDGPEVAATLQGVNESLAQHIDPQASLLLSDRWNTDVGEVGLLVDMSYKNIHTRSDEEVNQNPYWSNVVGPVPGAGSGPGTVCLAATCPVENAGAVGTPTVSHAQGVKPGYAAQTPTTTLYQQLGGITRASLVLSSQWKPQSNLQFYAEGFYTALRQQSPVMVDVLLQYVCPDPSKDTVYPGTNIISKSVSSCYNLTSDQDRHVKENTTQLAAGVDWAVTDNWDITSEVDTTLSESRTLGYVVDDTYNIPTDGLQLIDNYNGSLAHFVTSVGNPQLNPGGEYIDQFFDQRTLSKGSEWDWRIDSTYSFSESSFIKDIVTGFRIADRSAHNTGAQGSALNCITGNTPSLFYNNFILGANASQACTGPSGYVTLGSGGVGGATPQAAAANYTTIGGISISALAPNNAAAQTTSGKWFGGSLGIPGWTNLSPVWLWNNVSEIRTLFGYGNVAGGSTYIANGPPDSPANLFIVNETSKAGYIKADYGFDVFGFPVDGNVGIRFVDYMLTEQANSSTVTGTGANAVLTFSPTVATHETSVFLPSWNARVTLDDGLFWRMAASETATRPTFQQLNPATSFSAPGTTLQGSATSGNPNLVAEKSINLDTDLEYYWGKANHVSAAVFHRYVEGYIQTASLGQETVGGLVYNVTMPINYSNSYIDGSEIAYSQFLDFLPGFWSGFGWDTNLTYISGRFNNITKWHYNAAGIYEQGPWSVRLSYTWSSSYQFNPALVAGVQPPYEWAMPRADLDASINYRLNDQLTLTLDATNLNDGRYRLYDGHAPIGPQYFNVTYQKFDRTISFGLRYRM
jgi:TonB-dependent receptor